jgi:hypothetical protein
VRDYERLWQAVTKGALVYKTLQGDQQPLSLSLCDRQEDSPTVRGDAVKG